ncbi:MAG: N-acetyltransferase [Candidatus Omnitrophota bacterium]
MTEKIRKARIEDVKQMHSLINFYAEKDLMMPRSLNEIYENLRDFFVYEKNNRILACCALHIVGWEDLAELKSLAVKKSYQKKGFGLKLVKMCLDETILLGVKKVFALTYVPGFFKKLGFRNINKSKLPHKIWVECCNCPKFPGCDEVALIKSI